MVLVNYLRQGSMSAVTAARMTRKEIEKRGDVMPTPIRITPGKIRIKKA